MLEQVLSSYNYFSYEKDIKILNPNYIKTKNNFCYIRSAGSMSKMMLMPFLNKQTI